MKRADDDGVPESRVRSDSPCVRNCCLGHDDVCLGCFRTLAEILAWGPATEPERAAILALAADRSALERAARDEHHAQRRSKRVH